MTGPIDPADLARVDALLDALADDAVSWDFLDSDPAAEVLAALRADIDLETTPAAAMTTDAAGVNVLPMAAARRADTAPDPPPAGAMPPAGAGSTVLRGGAARRRRSHNAKRIGVAGVLAVAVLSASGVAAAGTLATHRGDPGHSIFTFFHGK